MRFLLLALATLSSVTADCSGEETCFKCIAMDGCAWYKAGSGDITVGGRCESDTFGETATGKLFVKAAECPACQAASCADCLTRTDGGACKFYTSPLGDKCVTSDTDGSSGGIYTELTVCPACDPNALTTCEACYMEPGCHWYEALGLTGACASEKPVGKTLRPQETCGKTNACSAQTCGGCEAIGKTNSSDGYCSWYTSDVPLVDDKCDYEEMSGVEGSLYKEVTGECQKCAALECGLCYEEDGCKWLDYAGFNGECVADDVSPGFGQSQVEANKCHGECAYYSCKDCAIDNNCAWYIPKAGVASLPGYNAQCNFMTEPTILDAAANYEKTSEPGQCAECAATTCDACYNLDEGCNYFQFSETIRTNRRCSKNAEEKIAMGTISLKLIPTDSEYCTGDDSGAFSLSPGLFSVLAAGLAIMKL